MTHLGAPVTVEEDQACDATVIVEPFAAVDEGEDRGYMAACVRLTGAQDDGWPERRPVEVSPAQAGQLIDALVGRAGDDRGRRGGAPARTGARARRVARAIASGFGVSDGTVRNDSASAAGLRTCRDHRHRRQVRR